MGAILRMVALSLVTVFVITFAIDYTEHNRTLHYIKNDGYKYMVNDSLNRGMVRLVGFEEDDYGNTYDLKEYIDPKEFDRALAKYTAFNIAPISDSFSYEIYTKENIIYIKTIVDGIESITKFSMEESEYVNGT